MNSAVDTPKSDSTRWFTDEVQPHEGRLRSYLRGSFPSVQDIDDVVQESYFRLWTARAAGTVRSTSGLLFRIARNISIDLVRRGHRSPVQAGANMANLEVAAETLPVADALEAREKLRLLADALDAITPRQRQLVILCKLQSKSHAEAARELGLSEKTVAEHLYRGVQSLGRELQRRGVQHFRP